MSLKGHAEQETFFFFFFRVVGRATWNVGTKTDETLLLTQKETHAL